MSQNVTKMLSVYRWPIPTKGMWILLAILVVGLTGCGVTTGVPSSGSEGSTPGGPGTTSPSGPAPTLISISPQSGTVDGGTAVKLTGTNFVSGATVTFGGMAATGVDVVDSSTITTLTPAHSPGETQVTVTNPDGQSASLSGALMPLSNAGFESGGSGWVLLGSGGSVTFPSNSANAHSGSGYAEISANAGDHPVLYAADSSNSAEYFAVTPGEVITFGGWGYHVSGDGKARWGLEVSDVNKENKIYYSAEPFNVKVSSWVNFQSSYTVPIGVAFVRFYCEVGTSTEPTVDRFDDAYLQIDIPDAGFNYVAETTPSGPPPILSSIIPQSGPIAGGTSVTLGGQNFLSGATVTFDGSAATSVQVVDSTTITALTPPHALGESNVTVTNPDGQSSTLIGNVSPLLNPGFELGSVNWQLLGSGGTATIQNNAANAHSGSYYAELTTSSATDHPVFYAADTNNVAQYVSVNPGDVITFGGWGYHASGDGKARWGLEVSDANKQHASYISAAPYNVTTSTWTYFQSSYTVPAGMAFVRFYCEIVGSSGASDDRFDDAFLQVDITGGGYDYVSETQSSDPPPTLTSITPQSGTTAGGTSVSLSGSNFASGATVSFNGTAATSVSVVNASTITAVTPPQAAGEANVTVTNPGGGSATLIGNITPLSNSGFESGAVDWQLLGSGGTATIVDNPTNAHSGNFYAELTTSSSTDHPVFYAANSSNVAEYFAVSPGDVLVFGGWGYHVSGDGKARWGIEVSNSSKQNAVYVSASPYNVTTASWTNFQGTYTVPTGMAYVRFYCEIVGSSGAADDRFDDAFLQINVPGGGFDYVTPASPPAISSLSETTGPTSGGDSMTISGANFEPGATVTFGGVSTSTTVVNSSLISLVTPASTAGSADVTVTNPDGTSATLASLLHNQSFESGMSYWASTGTAGTASIGTVAANAHVGTSYLQMASNGGSTHPVVYATTANGGPLYFPVQASQTVTFGGYAYRVSGGSNVRWGLEVSDANKANAIYVSAPPYSAYDPLWTLEQDTYTVPSGKSFVRLYAEVEVGSTATVGRFDDAFLSIGSGNSSAYLYYPPPIVTAVSPNWGAPPGGTTRTIYGTGFRSNATVAFGSAAGSNVQVVNANAIEVFAPPEPAGAVNVTVAQGTQSASLLNAYTYEAPPAPPAALLSMKHIIIELQENRSFDNYFSKMDEYRQMNGVDDNAVDERSSTVGLPDVAGQLITPFHAQTGCQENLSPSWDSEHYDYDNGLLDNFLRSGNQIGYSSDDPNGTRAISYYDWTDLPYYYSLAFQFATSDRYFSPLIGPTDPNRMYIYGATSLGWTATPHPPTGGFPNMTIFDLLDQAGISWKYYYQFATPLHIPYWSIYKKDPNKFVPITDYFSDVQSESTLPSVVFIEEGQYDEHPEPDPGTGTQTQNIQQGATVIKSFIDALMQSPTWQTSAFILSYDEAGGFDDHVVPPAAVQPDGIPPIVTIGTDASGLFNQYGFRLPLVVVSPWTIPHFVSHVVRDHTAILKLIETRFSLPPLTARDAASDNMTEFFNFASPAYMTPPSMPAQPTSDPCSLTLEAAPNQ